MGETREYTNRQIRQIQIGLREYQWGSESDPGTTSVESTLMHEMEQRDEVIKAGIKFDKVLELEGLIDQWELVHQYYLEGIVPGICLADQCDTLTMVSRDQTDGICGLCGESTVVSVFVLFDMKHE